MFSGILVRGGTEIRFLSTVQHKIRNGHGNAKALSYRRFAADARDVLVDSMVLSKPI